MRGGDEIHFRRTKRGLCFCIARNLVQGSLHWPKLRGAGNHKGKRIANHRNVNAQRYMRFEVEDIWSNVWFPQWEEISYLWICYTPSPSIREIWKGNIIWGHDFSTAYNKIDGKEIFNCITKKSRRTFGGKKPKKEYVNTLNRKQSQE